VEITGIRQILLEDHSRLLAQDRPGHPLRFATLKLTSECNLACSYCYAAADRPLKGDVMSTDTALRTIDRLARSKHRQGSRLILLWTGGEVLLEPRLLRRLAEETSHIRAERKVSMGIQTNATLLDTETIRWLRKHDFYIGLSLDGYRELHDKCRHYWRGEGSFADVERAMSLLRQEKAPFGLILVITEFNVRHLGQIIDWLYGQGVRNAVFNTLIMNLGRGITAQPLAPSSSEDLEAAKTIVNRMISINTSAAREERFLERNVAALVRNLVFLKSRSTCSLRSPCAAASMLLHFEANGDIYPCDQFGGNPEFRLGNIWSDDLDEIWVDHPVVNLLRSRTLYNIPECSACPWRLVCCGGCTAAAFLATGKVLAPAPTCEKHRALIPWILTQLKERRIDPEVLAFPNREGMPN